MFRPSPLASGTVPLTMPSPSMTSITVWPVFSSFPAASWKGGAGPSQEHSHGDLGSQSASCRCEFTGAAGAGLADYK
eukprot:2908167-Prymnesium_polylepis.2